MAPNSYEEVVVRRVDSTGIPNDEGRFIAIIGRSDVNHWVTRLSPAELEVVIREGTELLREMKSDSE